MKRGTDQMKKIYWHQYRPREAREAGICCYGPPEAEHLSAEDLETALADFFDEAGGPDGLPTTIEIHGYRRRDLVFRGWQEPKFLVDELLERLDEDYGNPDETTEATPFMVKAAEHFLECIKREYTVWACDAVLAIEVDVKTWFEQQRLNENLKTRARP